MSYNSRYVAYAKAHGKTPEEMMESERGMCGYIIWINQQLCRCRDTGHPDILTPNCTIINHEAFDRWLNESIGGTNAIGD